MHEVGPAGYVDRGVGQRLVHRDEGVAEAADALLLAESLAEGLAEHDRGVLDGVVAFDLDVAGGLDRQIEARVAAQRGQHVVEERHAGVDADLPGAVEIQLDDDVGFLGLAFNPCAAFGTYRLVHDAPIRALAASSASFSSARPMVVRRYPGMPTSRISTPASR